MDGDRDVSKDFQSEDIGLVFKLIRQSVHLMPNTKQACGGWRCSEPWYFNSKDILSAQGFLNQHGKMLKESSKSHRGNRPTPDLAIENNILHD